MTYQEVIDRFGTQVRLAAVLGITQSTVSSWGRVVPKLYQFQIEVLTHGELKADRALIPDRIEAVRRRPDRAA